MLLKVLTVYVFPFAEEDKCLFRHLCSKCYQVGRVSIGEACTLVIEHSQYKTIDQEPVKQVLRPNANNQ